MDPEQLHPSYSGHCNTVCNGDQYSTPGYAQLYQGPIGDISTSGGFQPAFAQFGSGIEGCGGCNSREAGNTYTEGYIDEVGIYARATPMPCCSSSMENSIEMGGSSSLGFKPVHCGNNERSNHRLAHDAERETQSTVHCIEVDGDMRRFDRSNFVPDSKVEAVQGCDADNNVKTGHDVEGGRRNELVLGSLDQKGSIDIVGTENGSGRKYSTGGSADPIKTQDSGVPTGHDHKIRWRSCRNGARVEYSRSYETFVKASFGKYKKMQHSITRRPPKSRLPKNPEEKASPLHVARIQPMLIDAVRERMSPSTLKRFDAIWQLTFNPVGYESFRQHRQNKTFSIFQQQHAMQLVENGVASKADGPGTLGTVPFTVVEEKDSGLRQRFILWTRDANEQLEAEGYEAKVPLQHISAYLPAVNCECASTRDFRTGFYAVEIPETSRKHFRFIDSTGSWWELTRLPMGHSCAPEIMHTIAAVTAGDPAYVKACYAVKSVRIDTWIDNIRYVGRKEDVSRETARLDKVAKECHQTWKASDSMDLVKEYTFLGVFWNHSDGTVRPSDKLLRRIAAADLDNMKAGDVESLGGRLMHAAAIAGVFPGDYWFALKYFRRTVNSLNRGLKDSESLVCVPPSVKKQLMGWIARVRVPRQIVATRSTKTFVVFIDASLCGWGGVIVNRATGEMIIVGDEWPTTFRSWHINELEARALFNTVQHLPGEVVDGHVSVIVDNTSVAGVARKKHCVRSKPLNDSVIGALKIIMRLKCSFSVSWIKSQDNPADTPSRVPLVKLSRDNLTAVQQAVGKFFMQQA